MGPIGCPETSVQKTSRTATSLVFNEISTDSFNMKLVHEGIFKAMTALWGE